MEARDWHPERGRSNEYPRPRWSRLSRRFRVLGWRSHISVLLFVVAAAACAQRGPATMPSNSVSRAANLMVNAQVARCSVDSHSLSIAVEFSTNRASETLSFASALRVRMLPGGRSVPFQATTKAGERTVQFVLGPLEDTGGVEEAEFGRLELGIPGSSVVVPASTLDGLVNRSVQTPIGTARVVHVSVQSSSLLVSVLFPAEPLGPSVVGSGAANATLHVGDVSHSISGTGITPMIGDGYVELFTFPFFSSLEGEARLELGEWQILVPSLSVPLGSCRA